MAEGKEESEIRRHHRMLKSQMETDYKSFANERFYEKFENTSDKLDEMVEAFVTANRSWFKKAWKAFKDKIVGIGIAISSFAKKFFG